MNKITKSRGAILPLVAIALLSLLAIGGAAMDFSHVFVARSSLQNALDAAALSAAKSVNNGSTTSIASSDGQVTFDEHIRGILTDMTVEEAYEYSATLSPFTPGASAPDAKYVRVSLSNHQVNTTLLRVVPGIGDFLNVSGSAVSGPIPTGTDDAEEVCDIAPLLICAEYVDDVVDDNCDDDDDGDGFDDCYGYNIVSAEDSDAMSVGDDDFNSTVYILKTNSKTAKDDDWEVGPGNFQLAELECGTGADCVRRELAGAGEGNGCIDLTDPNVNTEPGNKVGPVAQGFNTRFGIYNGPVSSDLAPPDLIIEEPLSYYDYMNYEGDQFAPDDLNPTANRRILAVQIGDCRVSTNGRGSLPRETIGCFFMTEKATHQGKTQSINGQFIRECEGSGESGTDPDEDSSMTTYRIILYKDPDSVGT